MAGHVPDVKVQVLARVVQVDLALKLGGAQGRAPALARVLDEPLDEAALADVGVPEEDDLPVP